MKIGNFDLDQRVLITAEIGVNHEGSFEEAQRLVQSAADAGVDAVKFQTYLPEHYISIEETERFERAKRFALSFDQFGELATLARSLGLIFYSTPLDIQSVDFLDPIVPVFKISSGDLTYTRLLRHVAGKGKPVILSTGAGTMAEIRRAVETLRESGPSQALNRWLALMHCVACYPAPLGQANICSIDHMRDFFGLTVGYSDHTLGSIACLGAVARGGRLIEKHFTLQKEGRAFRDHALSADPLEMAELVRQVRAIESALGARDKRPTACEQDILPSLRRGLTVARPLEAGAIVGESDLDWVRPAKGIPVGQEARVIGRRLRRALRPGQALREDDLI